MKDGCAMTQFSDKESEKNLSTLLYSQVETKKLNESNL